MSTPLPTRQKADAEIMSKSEREDLQRLIRQREKVLKSAAKQRSSELLADFENQMGSEYAFDDDAVWAQAMKDAEPVVAKAKAKIAARCRELGSRNGSLPT
jgi:vacuolar-type H+-ATPase subunit H